ncbi:MAG: hypothetical protein M0R73_13365 [Dehalococcoidia bacterium]|nr:hypothetical protein [Dehalococcoidia bacterium]
MALLALALVTAACSADDPPAVPDVVAERITEANRREQGDWHAVSREAVMDVEGFLFIEEEEESLPVRFRLSITSTSGGDSYDVLVSPECHDVIAVGDAWPSDLEACR